MSLTPARFRSRDAINAANSDGNPGVVDVIKFAPNLAGGTIKLDPGLGDWPSSRA